MYGIVMMAMLTTTPETVAFGHRANGGCSSAQASCTGRSGCGGLFGRGLVHRVLHREVLRRNRGCAVAPATVAPAPVKHASAISNCPNPDCQCPAGACTCLDCVCDKPVRVVHNR